ncbi:MAG: hypothetical protein ABIE07_07040 [Candidatus Zixiibacteriota bacterium]
MTDKKPPALKLVVNGQVREITFEELTLSNNLAQEALVRLLVDKKIINPKEMMEYLNKVKEERYKMEPPPEQSDN